MTTKEKKAVTRICNLITQMSGDNKKGYLIFCEGMAFEKELVSGTNPDSAVEKPEA